jgi:predicted dienelactone hydrolase
MNTTSCYLRVILLLSLIETLWAQPVITSQPKIQIMTLGATANFSVTATGTAPINYQWRLNEVNLADKTNRSLTLANVQLNNAGNYDVIVANASGSVTSKVAGLAFTTAHRFEAISANPNHSISLRLAGVVSKALAPYYDLYPLEVSTNLADWTPLATLQRTNDSVDALSYVDPEAANLAQRFYQTSTNFFVTPFPEPSGPYPVGTVSRLMTDSSRIRKTTPTNSSFMVTFWYPAQSRAGVFPDAYVDRKITLVPNFDRNQPSFWSSPGIITQFVSHALAALPLATNQTSYPVVMYSHGHGSHRQNNTGLAEELASRGYVVVAMDHDDAFASAQSEGQLVLPERSPVDSTECPIVATAYASIVANRIKDCLFVMDELSRLNTNDALLEGRLDLERLGAVGFSFGGITVAELARIDPRCKAVLLLDAGSTLILSTNLTERGLQVPFLSMSSTMGRPDCPSWGEWLVSSKALFAKATHDAFWCQLRDSTHASFGDKGSLINDPSATGNPTAGSKAQSQTIKACALAFFDKYLKGDDDHLLDNPAAVHPNIINFQKK